MGKRGPQKRSSEYMRVNGSPDCDRGLPTPPGVPIKPDWIEAMPVGSRVWDEVLDDLGEIPGFLSTLDTGALSLYCAAWQDYRDAAAIVAVSGMIAVSEKGGSYQHPAVGIRNKAREAIMRLGAMFGLNPSAREGLIVTGRTTDDELSDLIR